MWIIQPPAVLSSSLDVTPSALGEGEHKITGWHNADCSINWDFFVTAGLGY